MKNSTTWTAVAAAAALLALPVSGMAQTPQTQPPTAATQTQTPSAEQPDTAAAREHLSKARAALNDVSTTNAKAKTQIAELKRRLTTLERVAGGEAPATPAKGKAGANWGTEVAAMDKALTTLLGPDSATGAAGTTNPTTTGTTGSTATSKAAAATLDEPSRTKLMEVRQHITAFATVMAGGKTEPASPEPTAPNTSASTASAAGTTATSGTAGAAGSATSPTGTTGATGTSGTSATGASAAQPPATDPAQQPGQPQVDEGAARQHLTEARNTLSAMTQLPAAAQLTGEARTHISQLISNFNELITAQSQWRASYDKVEANLTALVGADTTAAATGTTGTSGTGTAGAVGTSGSGVADLDPAIRQKLIELRKNLSDFERAAGGEASAGSTTQPATAATAASGTAATSTTGTSGTTGSTAATTGTAGTTGAAASSSNPPATATADPAAQNTTAQAGNADIMRHVAAIDALLKLQDDSGGLTLTKTQVEQLRTHWAALRQALDRK